MDLSDLRIFSAVVREGGITRAAERLHRVQSNVTTRIRQLEEDIGAALFIRQGKRLHISPAGQVLLDYADRLLALADEARHAVQDPRPRGIFRLGAMESTAAVRLPGPLSEYHRRYPEVAIELRTGNPPALATAILAGELDAALVTAPYAEAPFEKIAVFEEEPVIVSTADVPAIGRKGTSPAPSLRSSTAARIASGWRTGTRCAAKCPNASSSSAPTMPCSDAWSPEWAWRCCPEAC